jgi:hypothetical protein
VNTAEKSMVKAAFAILLSLGMGSFSSTVLAQEAATPSAASARAIGTVTAINENTLTVKADSGSETKVTVSDSAKIVKTAPGQKDLKGATVINLQDIQVGDRALVRGTQGDGGLTASSVIVMKQSDVAGRQQQEMQDWQRRGTGGIVHSVDSAAGTITVGAGTQTTTIQTGPDTQFLRYAPDSVNFSNAKKSTLSEIQVGDQIRARGNRSADGHQITAEAVISGSFRNIAGTVNSVDASAGTVTVTDLIAKKTAVVKITPETQMRKIPAETAQRIAMFLRRPAGAAAPGGAPGTGASGNGSAPPAAQAGAGGDGFRGGAGGGQGGAPDFQRVIRAMPAATITDLQKGDAVMIVTTEGAPGQQVTALTLLSGVEPILTAAPSQTSAANLLSGWSMGGGEGEAQ